MSDEQPDTIPTADTPDPSDTAQAPDSTESAGTVETPQAPESAETPVAADSPATPESAETPGSQDPQAGGTLPKQAVFRRPRVSIVAAFLAMIAGTPLAWSSWWLASLYLVPIGFIVWILRNRTVVDTDGLTVWHTFSRRTIGWDRLAGLKIAKGKVRAALPEGDQVALPAVRTRHLPVLAAFSGGRIGNLRPPEKAA